jgi:hypothetical protein
VTRPWRFLGAGTALALLTVLAALSRLPYASDEPNGALLRLSWRARGESVERCRRATPAELAGVPAHMRQEVVCEDTHVAPYRLRVRIDGRTVEDGLVAGSGVSGDRPMYLLREFDLTPGRHRFEVLFERRSAEHSDDDRSEDRASNRRHEEEVQRRAVPRRLALDTAFVVPAGAVILITYNSELRELELLGGR